MSTVFELLEREWPLLAGDQHAARTLGGACGAAGGAATLDQLEQYVRTASPGDADRVLVILVAGAIGAVDDGVISAADAELIAASRIAGVGLADLAVGRGRHLRTLQYRRRRAEQALVAAAA